MQFESAATFLVWFHTNSCSHLSFKPWNLSYGPERLRHLSRNSCTPFWIRVWFFPVHERSVGSLLFQELQSPLNAFLRRSHGARKIDDVADLVRTIDAWGLENLRVRLVDDSEG